MHDSMKRLQEVARTSRNSEIATDLNVSASTVTNWSNRGVSKEGALAAAKIYGADANYILNASLSSGLSVGRTRYKQVDGFNVEISEDEFQESIAEANSYLGNSSTSVVELMSNLRELEEQGGLTPDVVRLLNATIDTFKMAARGSKNR